MRRVRASLNQRNETGRLDAIPPIDAVAVADLPAADAQRMFWADEAAVTGAGAGAHRQASHIGIDPVFDGIDRFRPAVLDSRKPFLLVYPARTSRSRHPETTCFIHHN
jgi:hypothetical protein